LIEVFAKVYKLVNLYPVYSIAANTLNLVGGLVQQTFWVHILH